MRRVIGMGGMDVRRPGVSVGLALAVVGMAVGVVASPSPAHGFTLGHYPWRVDSLGPQLYIPFDDEEFISPPSGGSCGAGEPGWYELEDRSPRVDDEAPCAVMSGNFAVPGAEGLVGDAALLPLDSEDGPGGSFHEQDRVTMVGYVKTSIDADATVPVISNRAVAVVIDDSNVPVLKVQTLSPLPGPSSTLVPTFLEDDSDAGFTDGDWHQVALVVDNDRDQVSLYVDCALGARVDTGGGDGPQMSTGTDPAWVTLGGGADPEADPVRRGFTGLSGTLCKWRGLSVPG